MSEVRLEDAPKVAKALRCEMNDGYEADCDTCGNADYCYSKGNKYDDAANLLDAQAARIEELETDNALSDELYHEMCGIKHELEAQLAELSQERDAAVRDINALLREHLDERHFCEYCALSGGHVYPDCRCKAVMDEKANDKNGQNMDERKQR